MSQAESSLRLEAYRDRIIAGMSDVEVAKAAGVAQRTVKRWRLANRITKPRGFASKHVEDVYAISQFGEVLGDVRHRAERSSLNGVWEPPVFVTRQHLDYSLFVRLIEAGKRVLGMTNEELSHAMGVSLGGIEQGVEIYERILRRSDELCLHCKAKLNPEFKSPYCSTICERLACTPKT
jgi:transposase